MSEGRKPYVLPCEILPRSTGQVDAPGAAVPLRGISPPPAEKRRVGFGGSFWSRPTLMTPEGLAGPMVTCRGMNRRNLAIQTTISVNSPRPLRANRVLRVCRSFFTHPDTGALSPSDHAGHRHPALFIGQAEPHPFHRRSRPHLAPGSSTHQLPRPIRLHLSRAVARGELRSLRQLNSNRTLRWLMSADRTSRTHGPAPRRRCSVRRRSR